MIIRLIVTVMLIRMMIMVMMMKMTITIMIRILTISCHDIAAQSILSGGVDRDRVQVTVPPTVPGKRWCQCYALRVLYHGVIMCNRYTGTELQCVGERVIE